VKILSWSYPAGRRSQGPLRTAARAVGRDGAAVTATNRQYTARHALRLRQGSQTERVGPGRWRHIRETFAHLAELPARLGRHTRVRTWG